MCVSVSTSFHTLREWREGANLFENSHAWRHGQRVTLRLWGDEVNGGGHPQTLLSEVIMLDTSLTPYTSEVHDHGRWTLTLTFKGIGASMQK